MKIHLNGAERDVPESCTVLDLLVLLGSDRPGVAVAVDNKVIPRSQHPTSALEPGARVEVIRAVGGG